MTEFAIAKEEMADVADAYFKTVIPAPIAYVNFAAIKKLVVEFPVQAIVPA